MYRRIREARQPFEFSDYDQNTDLFQNGQGKRRANWKFPGSDTKPGDFAELFSFEKQQAGDPTLADIMQYDVIAIKSCYPNSNLKSREELGAAQTNYQKIANFFEVQPDKKLIILTSPPLVPLKTTRENAARARQLANWLSSGTLARNVYIFDFFGELAAADGKQPHMLRQEYRRWLPLDAHPNPKASQTIAPKFIEFLQKTCTS